ncbi:unnamed protein product, partial [Arabidopsis halleri]
MKKFFSLLSLKSFREKNSVSSAVRLIPASVRQPPAYYAMVGSAIISVIDRFLFTAMGGLSPACVGSFGDVMAGFRLRCFFSKIP